MNSFIQGMKLFYYLPSVKSRNCILELSRSAANTIFYDDCITVSSLKILMPWPTRNFTIFAPFRKNMNDSEFQDNKERQRKKLGKNVSKISVIDENKNETIMDLANAEKLAKRKNMRLVKMDTRGEKVKYILEKIIEEPGARKQKDKDRKRVVLRDGTQLHDVEIKINQILKFLEKGLDVVCIIESSGKQDRMEELLQFFDKSKIKEYCSAKNITKKNVSLMFTQKSGDKKPEKEDK